MARDIYHNNVREALLKDGWTITADPLRLKSGDVSVEIDLGAERIIGAERAGERIAIEVKSFLKQAKLTNFYEALGQFRVYREVLLLTQPDRKLALAVDSTVFKNFFQKMLIKRILETDDVPLLVFDPEKNVIDAWINWKNTAR